MKRSPFDEPDFTPPAAVEITSIAQAVAMIEAWGAAYSMLHRELVRAQTAAGYWETLAKNEEVLRRHGIPIE